MKPQHVTREIGTKPQQMPGEGCCKANVKQISVLLKLLAFFIYNEATTGKMTQRFNNAAITGLYMRRC